MSTYQMPRIWRVQILATFSLVAVIGVAGVIGAAITGSRAGVGFVTVWLLIGAWNAYWFLLRIAYRLELTDTELRWTALFRQGSLPLADLVELRPHRFGSSIEIVISADGSKALVMVRKGFVDFLADVRSAAPHVKTRVGTLAKIGERIPGPRGYRRNE